MVAGGLVALALAGTLAGISPRLPILFATGAGCGVTLYHAAFGFTSAYRRLLVARDTAGVEAQLLMLAAATLLFAPVLAEPRSLGSPVEMRAAMPSGLRTSSATRSIRPYWRTSPQ